MQKFGLSKIGLIMLQKIGISNKGSSFDLCIHQRILKKITVR